MSDITSLDRSITYNASAVRLLRAAAELVGGEKALAQRLNICETILTRLMSGQYKLNPEVLLGAAGILADRANQAVSKIAQESDV